MNQVDWIETKLNQPKIKTGLEMKSKLDFTKDKLRSIILDIANINGYEKPTTYLDELLNEVKNLNSYEFECDFFLNIHYLCKEHANKFWNESHRKDITQWLGKSQIITSVFETTWESSASQQPETKTEQEQETDNDFTLSTIEDWLHEFKSLMTETDYQTLVSALKEYFDTGKFPTLVKLIQINGRPNKKLVGWHLNRIFEAKGKGIEKELLQFAKQNISLFKNTQFDENNYSKCNLYKYFTTKTK